MTSDYLKRPLRDLCPHCRQRPRQLETEVCERCELNAQAGIIDLDTERWVRKVKGSIEKAFPDKKTPAR